MFFHALRAVSLRRAEPTRNRVQHSELAGNVSFSIVRVDVCHLCANEGAKREHGSAAKLVAASEKITRAATQKSPIQERRHSLYLYGSEMKQRWDNSDQTREQRSKQTGPSPASRTTRW